MTEHNITLFEACEILNKSKKTLSRYIRRGLLNPERIKSQYGTLEYRFSKDDLNAFLAKEAEQAQDGTGQEAEDRTGQDTSPLPEARNLDISPKSEAFIPRLDRTRHGGQDKTGQDGTGQTEGIIAILRETTDLLKGQLDIKDKQIATLNEQVQELIERDRETNILLKGMQDKFLVLEHKKPSCITVDNKGQGRRQQVLWIILLITLTAFIILNATGR